MSIDVSSDGPLDPLGRKVDRFEEVGGVLIEVKMPAAPHRRIDVAVHEAAVTSAVIVGESQLDPTHAGLEAIERRVQPTLGVTS